VIKKPRKNEEAKARYWAVKIKPQWVVTPGKQTNKQQTLIQVWNRSFNQLFIAIKQNVAPGDH
jgi:hypothetical protein